MDKPQKPAGPSLGALVLVPAILTLIVTVLRLVGELMGWSELLFGTAAPGEVDAEGNPKFQGFVGIAWLVPIFGAWFGYRIRKGHGGPGAGRVFGLTILSIAIVIGGMFGLVIAGLMTTPTPEQPGEPQGLVYALGVLTVGAIVIFIAWGQLAWTLLVYGLLARIPVIVVTALSVFNDWDTHYAKLPVGVPPKEGMAKILELSTPQLTAWIAYTLCVGALFAAIGAAIAGDKSKS